jgi:outer membrane lipoprotein LolB
MIPLRLLSCALGAALVAACAVIEPAPVGPLTPLGPRADAAFAIEGRLSARRGSDAVAAGFSWRHDPPRDELLVTAPLGQVLAELSGDSTEGRVRLILADGRRDAAADWGLLTERALGFALPVGALTAWVRGVPHAASAFSVETDAHGRASVLRQDGWEIVYSFDSAAARQPSRLRLVNAELEVRIVIDRWS